MRYDPTPYVALAWKSSRIHVSLAGARNLRLDRTYRLSAFPAEAAKHFGFVARFVKPACAGLQPSRRHGLFLEIGRSR